MVAPYLSFSGRGWQIGALRIGGRASDGSITLACWHPRSSVTWHWSVTIFRGGPWSLFGGNMFAYLAPHPVWQWHDFWRLPFRWVLVVGRQDYHRRALDARDIAGLFTADPPFDAPADFTDAFNQIANGRD